MIIIIIITSAVAMWIAYFKVINDTSSEPAAASIAVKGYFDSRSWLQTPLKN